MTTNQLIGDLSKKLFEAEERRLNTIIIGLNKQNKELRRLKTDGFLFGGVFYVPRDTNVTIPGFAQAKPALHGSLNKAMEDYLKDRREIELEMQLIKQVLFTLLAPCSTDADRRNALPEFLVNLVPDLAAYHRTNEAAYTLRGNPRAMRQYEQILPAMEVYSATRLLY